MKMKKYYHITDSDNVQSILSSGILCNHKSVQSPFMYSSDKFDKHLDYELRTEIKDVVFICEDPVLALNKMGSYIPLYRLSVIELQLPEDSVLTSSFCYDFELVHSGTIDPKYIVGSITFIEFENKVPA